MQTAFARVPFGRGGPFLFRVEMKTVKRSAGHSATAAAAYRSGARIVDERTGEIHDYRKKRGIISSRIILPDNAPANLENRANLWNAAEAAENRKNSVTAREILLSLPADLSPDQRADLALSFGEWLSNTYQVAADVSLHAPDRHGDNRNHHAHILMTTRRVTADGFGEKTRELDDRKTGQVDSIRQQWETMANRALEQAGLEPTLSHESKQTRAVRAAHAELQAAQLELAAAEQAAEQERQRTIAVKRIPSEAELRFNKIKSEQSAIAKEAQEFLKTDPWKAAKIVASIQPGQKHFTIWHADKPDSWATKLRNMVGKWFGKISRKPAQNGLPASDTYDVYFMARALTNWRDIPRTQIIDALNKAVFQSKIIQPTDQIEHAKQQQQNIPSRSPTQSGWERD